MMEHGPIAVRHVKDLAPRDKQALEHLLGQPLTEDAQVFLTVVPLSVIRSVAKRERGWDALERLLDQAAKKMADASPEEFDAALTEAMRSVRPRYEA